MLACTCVKINSGNNGKKWDKLHNKLKEQLAKLDKQIDNVIE